MTKLFYCCERDVNDSPRTAPCLEGCDDMPLTVEGIVAASIEQQSVWNNALRHPGMEGY